MWPESGRNRHMKCLISTLLPAPDAPRITLTLPRSRSRSTWSSTRFGPNDFVSDRTRMCQRGSFWSGGLSPMISPDTGSGPSADRGEDRQQDIGEEVVHHDRGDGRDHDGARGADADATAAAGRVIALVAADGGD